MADARVGAAFRSLVVTVMFAIVPIGVRGDPRCAVSAAKVFKPLPSVSREQFRNIVELTLAGARTQGRSRWHALTGWTPSEDAGHYGIPDRMFETGRYHEAFAAFYAELFCNTGSSELNPQAYDSGAKELLQSALGLASRGNVRDARRLLMRANATDPAFIEGRYFLALTDYAEGDETSATASLQSALQTEGYAQPPDGWLVNRAQADALEKLLAGP